MTMRTYFDANSSPVVAHKRAAELFPCECEWALPVRHTNAPPERRNAPKREPKYALYGHGPTNHSGKARS